MSRDECWIKCNITVKVKSSIDSFRKKSPVNPHALPITSYNTHNVVKRYNHMQRPISIYRQVT